MKNNCCYLLPIFYFYFEVYKFLFCCSMPQSVLLRFKQITCQEALLSTHSPLSSSLSSLPFNPLPPSVRSRLDFLWEAKCCKYSDQLPGAVCDVKPPGLQREITQFVIVIKHHIQQLNQLHSHKPIIKHGSFWFAMVMIHKSFCIVYYQHSTYLYSVFPIFLFDAVANQFIHRDQ